MHSCETLLFYTEGRHTTLSTSESYSCSNGQSSPTLAINGHTTARISSGIPLSMSIAGRFVGRAPLPRQLIVFSLLETTTQSSHLSISSVHCCRWSCVNACLMCPLPLSSGSSPSLSSAAHGCISCTAPPTSATRESVTRNRQEVNAQANPKVERDHAACCSRAVLPTRTVLLRTGCSQSQTSPSESICLRDRQRLARVHRPNRQVVLFGDRSPTVVPEALVLVVDSCLELDCKAHRLTNTTKYNVGCQCGEYTRV